MSNVTPHFRWSEFACKDGTGVPDEFRRNTERLAKNLETIRAHLGGLPVTVISGYRTKAYNDALPNGGGAKRSQHLTANAADIRVKGRSPKDVGAEVKSLIANGEIEPGGVGIYTTFVHYDRRGKYKPFKG